jgi:SAM-dependent MidA family methyltransferase
MTAVKGYKPRMKTPSVPTSLPILPTPQLMQGYIHEQLAQAGGWLPFDAFMAHALYAPGLGYYTNERPKLGHMPSDGSDFVTAPELSPIFGRTLAKQVAQAMQLCSVSEVWEFGGGTGALAEQVIDSLLRDGVPIQRYVIVELSAMLRAKQEATLAHLADKVELQWVTQWPDEINAVVLGNEVLDAMPVKLMVRTASGEWRERGVVADDSQDTWCLRWQDQATALRPDIDVQPGLDYWVEWHQQAQAWMRSLASRLRSGAAFLVDYGFTHAEYYHPQRHMGTLMCHYQHTSDTNPLVGVGLKDITVHVDFTAAALAAQDGGLDVLGYTSQGRFLLNCGLVDLLPTGSPNEQAQALKLVHEHEMGELFKVLALVAPANTQAVNDAGGLIGFTQFDRTHTL